MSLSELIYEPAACENCHTTEEGCTDNYWPGLGWICQSCRDWVEEEEQE